MKKLLLLQVLLLVTLMINAQVISELYVPSSKRGLVPMNNVVRLTEEKGPNQIDRLDRERQVGPLQGFRSRIGKPFATVLKLTPSTKSSLISAPTSATTKLRP
jgi:hypothetical protein